MFDKARDNAAAYAADFVGNADLSNAATKTGRNYLFLIGQFSELLVALLSDYGVKSIKVAFSARDFERYQIYFLPDHTTSDAEYVSVLRLWNDINSYRKEGDDGILVMADENNLPILSCDCDCLRNVLHKLCSDHRLIKYYRNFFETIDAVRQRAAMGETPRMN